MSQENSHPVTQTMKNTISGDYRKDSKTHQTQTNSPTTTKTFIDVEVGFESEQTSKNVKLENIANPYDFNLAIAFAKMNDSECITVTEKLFNYLCKEVGETPELMYQGVLVKVHGKP